MTYLEYFERSLIERNFMLRNLAAFRASHGYEFSDPKALAKYQSLDEECENLIKCFADGTIDPENEYIMG